MEESKRNSFLCWVVSSCKQENGPGRMKKSEESLFTQCQKSSEVFEKKVRNGWENNRRETAFIELDSARNRANRGPEMRTEDGRRNWIVMVGSGRTSDELFTRLLVFRVIFLFFLHFKLVCPNKKQNK